jgi:hypothetical protein
MPKGHLHNAVGPQAGDLVLEVPQFCDESRALTRTLQHLRFAVARNVQFVRESEGLFH